MQTRLSFSHLSTFPKEIHLVSANVGHLLLIAIIRFGWQRRWFVSLVRINKNISCCITLLITRSRWFVPHNKVKLMHHSPNPVDFSITFVVQLCDSSFDELEAPSAAIPKDHANQVQWHVGVSQPVQTGILQCVYKMWTLFRLPSKQKMHADIELRRPIKPNRESPDTAV